MSTPCITLCQFLIPVLTTFNWKHLELHSHLYILFFAVMEHVIDFHPQRDLLYVVLCVKVSSKVWRWKWYLMLQSTFSEFSHLDMRTQFLDMWQPWVLRETENNTVEQYLNLMEPHVLVKKLFLMVWMKCCGLVEMILYFVHFNMWTILYWILTDVTSVREVE